MDGNIRYAYYDQNKSFVIGSSTYNYVPSTDFTTTISITIPNGVAYIRVSSQHVGRNQGANLDSAYDNTSVRVGYLNGFSYPNTPTYFIDTRPIPHLS